MFRISILCVPMRILKLTLPVLIGCLLSFHAEAVILYGGGNSTNITDPGTGLPWTNVVEMEDSLGSAVGSGVYLNDQFVLTANHVSPISQIVIGGSVFFVDTTFNASFAGGFYTNGVYQVGNTDLKLLRLTQNPATHGVSGLQSFNLNTSHTVDTNPGTTNYILGYGYGKGTAVTGGWNWDAGSVGVERWGTNNIGGTQTIPNGSWSTNTLLTQFGSTAGTDEAAITMDDSGGALFLKSGSTWYLSGISLYVSSAGTTYYTGDPNVTGPSTGSVNAFGRISDYESQIAAATAVPEPSVFALALFSLGAVILVRRTARRAIPTKNR